ncbi:hypothetical protein [Algiphilus aromaticivorans]|uniref:hypothetical protein n=1 Tax=Algiphilus aromaticivorans TaxID=382454 RepID=UPI0005C22D01|nr:hypothetical protein [Algiphilus aromaticivorans]
MTDTVRIYYVGRKAAKKDNLMRDSGRVWEGYGTYHDVWAPDAPKYLKHPDVWSDKKPSGKQAPEAPPATDDGEQDATAADDSAGEYENDERMSAIIEAIQRLGSEDYTTQGKPKVNAVVSACGFSVSASEIADAVHYLSNQAA